MREALIGLEGSIVFFEAIVDTWEKSPEDFDDFLLRPVKIWSWDCNSPVRRGEPIRIDHLWFRCPKDDRSEHLERLQEVTGAGVVNRYQRSNGSWDLGVRHTLPTVNLDRRLMSAHSDSKDVPSGLPRDEFILEKLIGLRSLLDQCLAGEMFGFSTFWAVDEFRDNIEQGIRHETRCIEATRSRLATCTRSGKPKGLDLRVPKCRRRPAPSFG